MRCFQLSSKLDKADLAKQVDGSKLKDRNVLVTGGASGLGAGIVRKFAEEGACVTIADIQVQEGEAYAAELRNQGLSVIFVRTDVTSWSSQIKAFKAAIAHSPSKDKIDIVLAFAGVFDPPFFTPGECPPSLEEDPPVPVTNGLEVNLKGLYYTAKLAQHYFGLPSNSQQSYDKTLILISSLLAYWELPLACSYNASKWGVRALFRTLREPLASRGIRLNMIAPWLQPTPMLGEMRLAFESAGAPIGSIDDVVKIALRCAVDEGIVGRAFVDGPFNIIDLGDDLEGKDGTEALHEFEVNEVPGFKEVLLKAVAILMNL